MSYIESNVLAINIGKNIPKCRKVRKSCLTNNTQ